MSSFIRFERRGERLVPVRHVKEWAYNGAEHSEFRTVRITELPWPDYRHTLRGNDEMWPPHLGFAYIAADKLVTPWWEYPQTEGPFLHCDHDDENDAWQLPPDYLDYWRWQGTDAEWEQRCEAREGGTGGAP